jgi:hypothetical protein
VTKPDTELTRQLESAGYKYWHDTTGFKQFTQHMFQKCIKDDIGKKFYINIWHYDQRTYGETTLPESLCIEVQFQTLEGDILDGGVVNVELNTNKFEVAEVYLENMWLVLGYDYYDKWE